MKCRFKDKRFHCNLLGCKYLCSRNCKYKIAYENGDNIHKSFCEYVAFECDRSKEEKPTIMLALKFHKGR